MKYLRIEKNYPETLTTSITYKATEKPNELFKLIRDDEDNLIQFIVDEYNSKLSYGEQFVGYNEVTVIIGRQSLEFWSIYCNSEFLLFGLKIITESEKLLEELKR